jgi:hypothetical protein
MNMVNSFFETTGNLQGRCIATFRQKASLVNALEAVKRKCHCGYKEAL